nr:DUF2029 domain-containing protein [Actinomycetota bacterium]
MSARALTAGLGALLVSLAVALGLVLRSGAAGDALAPLIAIVAGAFAVYALAAVLVVRGHVRGRFAVGLVLVVALAARLALAVHEPTISRDAYRYVWDGEVAAAGINPYRYPPADPALAGLRDRDVYPSIDRKQAPTIYPPVAQGLFRALHELRPGSIVAVKLAFVALDLVAICLVMLALARFGLRPERAILYAWHPLAIVEIGHSGHVDGVAALLVLAAVLLFVRGRPLATGVALAAATLVKLYAVAALPALLWRDRVRDLRLVLAFAATVVLAYLPFLGVGTGVLGYLPGYVEEEGFASGERFYLAPLTPGIPFVAVVVCAMAALALVLWRSAPARGAEVPSRVLLLFVSLLVLATPAYPWYGLLALLFLPFARGVLLLPATVLGGTALLLYVHLKASGEPAWPLHVAYAGGAAALA